MMVMIQNQAFAILRIAVTYLTIHKPPNTQSKYSILKIWCCSNTRLTPAIQRTCSDDFQL
jgi:hypothetical protein